MGKVGGVLGDLKDKAVEVAENVTGKDLNKDGVIGSGTAEAEETTEA